MKNQEKKNKEKSLYEFYTENSYQTAYVPTGRNFSEWNKEQKMAELNKLLKEFKNPSAASPRGKTYNLIDEIFDSSPIPKAKIDGNANEIMIEYCGCRDDVYECMKNDSNDYYYSVEKEQKGTISLDKMIDFWNKYSD